MVRVFIQRVSSGRFLKAENEWVRAKDDATEFPTSTAAMEFCMRRKINDVGLLLSFDSGTEVRLDVFDRNELMEAVARALVENARLREESAALIAMLDGIIAEGKERRKSYPFKPHRSDNADAE